MLSSSFFSKLIARLLQFFFPIFVTISNIRNYPARYFERENTRDKKFKPINLSLYSDYNPKTTTHGLGFKNKEKALYTVDTIKNRPIKYQVNVIATMLGRAKKHPYKTKEMNDAIKVFSKWMSNYKESSKK